MLLDVAPLAHRFLVALDRQRQDLARLRLKICGDHGLSNLSGKTRYTTTGASGSSFGLSPALAGKC